MTGPRGPPLQVDEAQAHVLHGPPKKTAERAFKRGARPHRPADGEPRARHHHDSSAQGQLQEGRANDLPRGVRRTWIRVAAAGGRRSSWT